MSVYDVLEERGFIRQLSHPEDIKKLLEDEKVTFYIGFDPTADSLHVGHYVQLMAMAHMQRAGHTPIALLGGGTTMVGDPSGKTDMRKLMTREMIAHNAERFKAQMSRIIDFTDDKAIMVNNADWLLELNYVDFLREIGVYFSVNRMLTADCYKQRLERGLTFFEFNYMLMQSYDFLVLYRKYGCTLQLGGDDQWSNILAGADLIRRKESANAFALTFALLTTSDGRKMGKTEKGAVWLDSEKTSPYDFYQYWRNVDDADVEKCLALLTFLPMDEIRALCASGGSALNQAKTVLAFELTKQIHGEAEAQKAKAAAEALFGGGGDAQNIPTLEIDDETFASNPRIIDLLALCSLAKSKSDARRLIEGGGVFAGDKKVESIDAQATAAELADGLLLRKGKKAYCRILLK